MPAYLARLAKDHQLVGIYFAEDAEELFWTIDECCDPGEVEITEIGQGGIHWPNSIDFPIPTPEDRLEDTDGLPSGSRTTERWTSIIVSPDSDISWIPVPGPADNLE